MDQCSYSSSHNDDDNGDKGQTSRASSSLNPPGQCYEVFLNFRGIDTRHGFTDHLYRKLVDAGFWVFRDSEELHVGEMIGPELLRAITTSKVSIPIISSNYASSKWCLMELVQILQCRKMSGQLVLPIFYKVDPSDVKNQTGCFKRGFRKYQKDHHIDGKLVQEWKNALKEVTSLKGWESNKIADKHEGALVKIVVARVFEELRKAVLVVPDLLIGVEDHMKKIMEMIVAKPLNHVKIIGIHGMGGIGKTTLAKVLYNKLSNNFEYCSFIPNIRETSSQHRGMEALQMQLISDIFVGKSLSHVDEGITILEKSLKGKKLLLLLDDVDNKDQLNKLAAKESWFGLGSIVIVTTRNRDLTVTSTVNMSYELNELSYDQSFILFCKHAFGSDASCPREFQIIAKEIICTTGGLPLAIEIIGSLLFQKSKEFWEATRNRLRRIPNSTVQDKLKISYDILEHEQKQIFLDIACLPIRHTPKFASYMWDACGYYPGEGIQILISLSLIKIGDENHMVMHDQLRDLGREIVRRESYDNIGERSRLWFQEEVMEVIKGQQGTTKVQALNLIPDGEIHCTSQQFEHMTKLRFLRMKDVHLVGDFKNIFLNLRWIEWKRDPIHAYLLGYYDFMGVNIHLEKLVVMDLSYTNIEGQWIGWSRMKNLKVLKLEHCDQLTTTPDFSTLQELEILNLRQCVNLRKIHPSISILSKRLKTMDVAYCTSLEELPRELGEMENLRELIIDGTKITGIPIAEGFMMLLERLSAEDCGKLASIPDSIGCLVKLRCLVLKGCKSLTKIPESIGKLESLRELNLRGTVVKELPNSIGDLCNLELLDMADTHIKCLPTSIGMLSQLQKLDLEDCMELQLLSNLPSSLTSLRLDGHSMVALPGISNLINLNYLKYRGIFMGRSQALYLEKMNRLKILKIYDRLALSEVEVLEMPENINLLSELPSSLVKLYVHGCRVLGSLLNLSNLKNLSKLRLCGCSELVEVSGLEEADSLSQIRIEGCRKLSRLSGLGVSMTHLELDSLDALESLPHLSTAKNLSRLIIRGCSKLVEIQGLDKIDSLQKLELNRCCSLERIGDLSYLKMLTSLKLSDCEKLRYVRGIEKLVSLMNLSISRCSPRMEFPDLSMLTNLEILKIKEEELRYIPGLQEVKSLEELYVSRCKSLQFLPDFSQFTNLEKLDVSHCEELREIQGLEKPSCASLFIGGCTKLTGLPDSGMVWIYPDPLDAVEEENIWSFSSQSTSDSDPMEVDEETERGRDVSQPTSDVDEFEEDDEGQI